MASAQVCVSIKPLYLHSVPSLIACAALFGRIQQANP